MLPAVKTLRHVFGDNAKRAREVLEMDRCQLDALPTPAMLAHTYNPPATSHLRLCILDGLAGTHGVESFETKYGWCDYLNTGDSYAPTLVWFRGRYQVASWGDIAERHATREG